MPEDETITDEAVTSDWNVPSFELHCHAGLTAEVPLWIVAVGEVQVIILGVVGKSTVGGVIFSITVTLAGATAGHPPELIAVRVYVPGKVTTGEVVVAPLSMPGPVQRRADPVMSDEPLSVTCRLLAQVNVSGIPTVKLSNGFIINLVSAPELSQP